MTATSSSLTHNRQQHNNNNTPHNNNNREPDDRTADTPRYAHSDPQSTLNSSLIPNTDQPEFLPGTMIPYEMYRRYRLLLEQKRDLKKELKLFDEKFSKDTGRVPKKTDKEVREELLSCND